MKKKYLWAGIGTALLLAVLISAVWLAPLIQTAFLLQGMSKSGGFQFEIAIELEEENLSKQQEQMIRMLAWALAGRENSGMSWEINGRVSEGLAYGEVFCKGCSEPITELYFGQEEGFINLEMLYDSMRDNMLRQQPFLGGVLPEWGYGAFLSSRQVEEIFQVDLEELFWTDRLAEKKTYSVREILGFLWGMKRQKSPDGGYQFEAEVGDYQAVLEIIRKDQIPLLKVLVSDRTRDKEISSYKGKFVFHEAEEIVLPESRMEEEDIRQFEKLWESILGFRKSIM